MHVPIVGHVSWDNLPELMQGKPFRVLLPLGASIGNPAKKVAVFDAFLNSRGTWCIKHSVRQISEGESGFQMAVWPDAAMTEEVFYVSGEARVFMEYLHGMRGELLRGGESPMVDWFEVIPPTPA